MKGNENFTTNVRLMLTNNNIFVIYYNNNSKQPKPKPNQQQSQYYDWKKRESMRMQTIQFRVRFKIASDYYDTESNEYKKKVICYGIHICERRSFSFGV